MTDVILIGGGLLVAYFLFFKPKTTTPLLPGQVTSITPISAGGAGTSTAALVSAGGGLFSTISNLFKPGSAPSASNVITESGGEAGVTLTNDNPLPVTLNPVAVNNSNTSGLLNPGLFDNVATSYSPDDGDDELSFL